MAASGRRPGGLAVFLLLTSCGDRLAEREYAGTPQLVVAGAISAVARPVKAGEPLNLELAWAHLAPLSDGSPPRFTGRPNRQEVPIVATGFPAEFSFSVVEQGRIAMGNLCPAPVLQRLQGNATDSSMVMSLRNELQYVAFHALVDPAVALEKVRAIWQQLSDLPDLTAAPHDSFAFSALLDCYVSSRLVALPKDSGAYGWPACFDVADITLTGTSSPGQMEVPVQSVPGLGLRAHQNILATAGKHVLLAAPPELFGQLGTARCAKGIHNPSAIKGRYHLAKLKCTPGESGRFGFEIVDESSERIELSAAHGPLALPDPCDENMVLDFRVWRSRTPSALSVAADQASLELVIEAAIDEAKSVFAHPWLGEVTVRGMNAQGQVELDALHAPERHVTTLHALWSANQLMMVSYGAAHDVTGWPWITSQSAGLPTEHLPPPPNIIGDALLAAMPDGRAIAESLARVGCAPTGSADETLKIFAQDGDLTFSFWPKSGSVPLLGVLDSDRMGVAIQWINLGAACSR